VREYVRCRELIDGTGSMLLGIATDHANAHALRQRSLTLRALKDRFLADPETKKRSKIYLDDLCYRWRRFEDHFGAETIVTDTATEKVREWLNSLPVSDLTKGNFHRNISPVFSYATYAGLLPENPLRKHTTPKRMLTSSTSPHAFASVSISASAASMTISGRKKEGPPFAFAATSRNASRAAPIVVTVTSSSVTPT